MHQDWTDWTGTPPDSVHARMDLWFLPSGPTALHHDRAMYHLTVVPCVAELLLN